MDTNVSTSPPSPSIVKVLLLVTPSSKFFRIGDWLNDGEQLDLTKLSIDRIVFFDDDSSFASGVDGTTNDSPIDLFSLDQASSLYKDGERVVTITSCDNGLVSIDVTDAFFAKSPHGVALDLLASW